MLAAALAALAIGSASAETIYITGSTAFRKAANDGIQYWVTNTMGGAVLASDSGDNGAGNVVWQYTNSGNSTTNYIVAYWSGSEAGIQSVAGPASSTAGTNYSTNKYTGSYANLVKAVTSNNAVNYRQTNTATVSSNAATAAWVAVTTNTFDASLPNMLPFWDPTQTFQNNGSGKTTNATITKVTNIAHIAFSDTYQASSAFGAGRTVAYYATNNLYPGQTNKSYYGIKSPIDLSVLCPSNSYTAIAATNDNLIGVVGFGFIVSPNGSPSYLSLTNGIVKYNSFTNGGIVNITKLQAADLFKKGAVNLAQYTGNLDDTNRVVYAVGRSIDSGTRLVTLSLLGLGTTVTNTGVNTGINQYLVLGSNGFNMASANAASSASVFVAADGTSFTNTNTTLLITNFPADVTVGKLCATGHNGYASGGSLCKVVGSVAATNSPSNAVVIGYAGIPDANGNATVLAYEGVYPSTGAIKSGAYAFWSYEHLMIRNDATTEAQNAYSGILSQIQTYSTATLQSKAACTLKLSDVTNNLTRSVDGGVIVKKWTNSVTLTNLPSYYTSSKQATAGAGAGF